MPEWRVWDGTAGKVVGRLPAKAEKSADGKWAAIRVRDRDGRERTVATFIRVASPDDQRKK